ncbi:phasin family protein [Paraburkholderia sp. RL17-383-BIF-A]|jgi:phasin family protein|uniref:phasin family protein n=1 Tax=Burkholderiaceae TaxID=119060 RepID=UPI0008960640|nr:phasin family protein [Burkholderia sp. WP9]SEE85709.1 phasin family protein [Burkholderia sp. WP9]
MYPQISDQFSSRQRDTAIEVAFDCNTEVLAGVEKVVELNIQTVKTSLSEQQALADAALSAQSLSEVFDLQSQQFPAAVTKTFAYWRHVEEIAADTRIGLFNAMQAHFGSSLNTLAEMVDMACGNAFVQERGGILDLPGMAQSTVASAERVGIVDSSGRVVSSDDVRGDLH